LLRLRHGALDVGARTITVVSKGGRTREAIHPDTITDWFTRLSWEAGLPPIRLHDVRHSYATAALRAGVAVKVVSERLGHSSVAFTQDTYMHVIPGMDEHGARVAALAILGPPEAASDTAVTTGVTIRADTPLA
jgi:integrase